MSGSRLFHGVSDSVKHLGGHWQGDMTTGFPARIKAVREDGICLDYLPSDEVDEQKARARNRGELMRKLIEDMHRALKSEDKPYRLYGIGWKLAEFERRMEELGIEVGE